MPAKKKVSKKKVSKKKTAKKKVVKKKAADRKNKQPITKKNPKGAGNAPKDHKIDWDKVNKLCVIQCTGEEIASVLEVDYDTLNKYCKKKFGVGFGKYLAEKREGGKASLRRRQWLTAESGNAVMQIFLGKQYLGQKDKVETDNLSSDGSMSPNAKQDLTDDELQKEIEKYDL